MAHEIFISYAHDDKPVADAGCSAMAKRFGSHPLYHVRRKSAVAGA